MIIKFQLQQKDDEEKRAVKEYLKDTEEDPLKLVYYEGLPS